MVVYRMEYFFDIYQFTDQEHSYLSNMQILINSYLNELDKGKQQRIAFIDNLCYKYK